MLESMLHRLLRSYRNHVGRFVVPSQFYIDKFCEWGFPRGNSTTFPISWLLNATCRTSRRAELRLFRQDLSRKGLATLIRAVAVVGCSLQIIGTGPQLEELRNLATELGADVTFLGYLTGEALHHQVGRARAVVLPSEWYENAPMSVLEAYGLGKPVIGARIGGFPSRFSMDARASRLRVATRFRWPPRCVRWRTIPTLKLSDSVGQAGNGSSRSSARCATAIEWSTSIGSSA